MQQSTAKLLSQVAQFEAEDAVVGFERQSLELFHHLGVNPLIAIFAGGAAW